MLSAELAGDPAAGEAGEELGNLEMLKRFLAAALIVGVVMADGAAAVQVGEESDAVKFYRKAAEEGKASAQFMLGSMYNYDQDYREAIKWFRLAADQGYVGAQQLLALMYAQGHGVQQDLVLAYMWCSLATANDSNDDFGSAVLLDTLGKQMTAEQIAKAQRLARDWKPPAAH